MLAPNKSAKSPIRTRLTSSSALPIIGKHSHTKSSVPGPLLKRLLNEHRTLSTEQKHFGLHVALASSVVKLWSRHEDQGAFEYRARDSLPKLAQTLAQLAASDSPDMTGSYLSFGGGDVATEQVWPVWAVLYAQSGGFGNAENAEERVKYVEEQLLRVLEESTDRIIAKRDGLGSGGGEVGLGLMLSCRETVEVGDDGQVRLSADALPSPVDGVDRTLDDCLGVAKRMHQFKDLGARWTKMNSTDRDAALAVVVREAVTSYHKDTGKGDKAIGPDGKVSGKDMGIVVAKAAFSASPQVFMRLVLPITGGTSVVPVALSFGARLVWGGELDGKITPAMVAKAATDITRVLAHFASGNSFHFRCGTKVRSPIARREGTGRPFTCLSDLGQVLEAATDGKAVKGKASNSATKSTRPGRVDAIATAVNAKRKDGRGGKPGQ